MKIFTNWLTRSIFLFFLLGAPAIFAACGSSCDMFSIPVVSSCDMVLSCQPLAEVVIPANIALTCRRLSKDVLEILLRRAARLIETVYRTGVIDITGIDEEKGVVFGCSLSLWNAEASVSPDKKIALMTFAMPLLFSRCLDESFEVSGTSELSVACMQAVLNAFVQHAKSVLSAERYAYFAWESLLEDEGFLCCRNTTAFVSCFTITRGVLKAIGIRWLAPQPPALSPDDQMCIATKIQEMVDYAITTEQILSGCKIGGRLQQVKYQFLPPCKTVDSADKKEVIMAELQGCAHLLVNKCVASFLSTIPSSANIFSVITAAQQELIKVTNRVMDAERERRSTSDGGGAGCA